MPSAAQQSLIELQPTKEFFIGIDSDGCVFDTMEIKHKECFCPNFIKHYELQAVSRYAREAWEFVNLYSKNRGVNRFLALIEVMKLLRERSEVKTRFMEISPFLSVQNWIKGEAMLGNPTLIEFEKSTNDPEITKTLNWSLAVNDSIEDMVHGIAPFPFVKESLEKIGNKSDAMVISQTPVEALQREWKENEMDAFVRIIAGQEFGKKQEHLALAAVGKYPKEKILMIGDAPGDRKAAEANGVFFYPIIPGQEESSWNKFHSEALRKFYKGEYAGEYQEQLIGEFEACLPENPPWNFN